MVWDAVVEAPRTREAVSGLGRSGVGPYSSSWGLGGALHPYTPAIPYPTLPYLKERSHSPSYQDFPCLPYERVRRVRERGMREGEA